MTEQKVLKQAKYSENMILNNYGIVPSRDKEGRKKN
jgi:hypothetical protein